MSWLKLFVALLLALGLVVVCLTFNVWAASFLGLLFALSLNGPADWLRSKWHMPAWTATLVVMLVVLATVAGLGFLIGSPLAQQADELSEQLPLALQESVDWLEQRAWGQSAVQEVESFLGVSSKKIDNQTSLTKDAEQATAARNNDDAENTNTGQSIVLPILQTLGSMLSLTASTTMLILVSLVITLYIALNPDVYRRGILWLIPAKHETLAKLTMTRICTTLRWWMLGRLTSMLVVGMLTSLGMWIVGMPAPLALGALAGLLSFVPNLGPIVAALPGLLIAIPLGPWMLLSAVSVYLAAQLIESNLITPMVDQYTVATPAAVLILTQVIMGVLAGAWGVIVATPLLVVAMVMTQQLYVREFINKKIHVIGSPEEESPDPPTETPKEKHQALTAPAP